MVKKLLIILIGIITVCNISFAQTAKIVTEAVSHEVMAEMGLPSSTFTTISSGLNVVPNGTFIYLSAMNANNAFADPSKVDPILAVTWTLASKPAASNASFIDVPNQTLWKALKVDAKGEYVINLSITTAKGTSQATATYYSADFVGTGGFDDVPAAYPNCMTCHSASPKFTEIFNKWKVSGHATKFRGDITTGTNHYATYCLECHTVGYNPNADNGGFDEKASALGWSWDNYKPPKPGNWDTLKIKYPSLVAYASIGCEMCHGPGSEHAMSAGNTDKIQISSAEGACAQCHDEPWRHNKVAQWRNSAHSEMVWSSSFVSASGNNQKNDLGNCVRCHDGQAFINFTKGETTDASKMTAADLHVLSCATCHDPHGSDNTAQLRTIPESSDTLGNGYKYSATTDGLGSAMVCVSCHKARKDNVSYAKTTVNSTHWGPHGSVQADVLLGKNAAEFGTPYTQKNFHMSVMPINGSEANGCVDCHMQETSDTGTVTRDRVGGHTWSLHDEKNDVDHTTLCQKCHTVDKWEDLKTASFNQDYDGNGAVESIQKEVQGLLKKLSIALPPVGIDSISYTDIGKLNDVNVNKALWNYQLIANDGSYGIHNPKFAIAVLQQSLFTLTGVEQVNNLTPKVYSLEQNFPNPFNPATKIMFSIPDAGDVTLKVYDAIGNELATLHKGYLAAGNYSFSWNAAKYSSGVYFYKLTAGSFSKVKKMILMK